MSVVIVLGALAKPSHELYLNEALDMLSKEDAKEIALRKDPSLNTILKVIAFGVSYDGNDGMRFIESFVHISQASDASKRPSPVGMNVRQESESERLTKYIQPPVSDPDYRGPSLDPMRDLSSISTERRYMSPSPSEKKGMRELGITGTMSPSAIERTRETSGVRLDPHIRGYIDPRMRMGTRGDGVTY